MDTNENYGEVSASMVVRVAVSGRSCCFIIMKAIAEASIY